MIKPGFSESRESESDLCITFEVNGEKYTFCIGADTMKATSKGDISNLLGDYLSCSLCCYKKSGFAACMARCVAGDGKCCDSGATNCE
jgi:hypothetical protein